LKDPESLHEQLRHLEAQLLDPEIRTSPAALDGLLAGDFVEFGSSGHVYDKPQIIASMQRGSGPRYTMRDFQARLLGPGVALATYRSIRSGPGGTPTQHALRCSIWKFEDGRWRVTFHQGTPTQD
jgi:hypothetical protein